MHKLLLAGICLVWLGCSSSKQTTTGGAAPNTLTKKEQEEGWKLLFDGTTKNGWHVFNNRSDGSAWKVADGMLYLDPTAKGPNNAGGGDLVTDQAYDNYHLKLDWKIDSNGNSGIIFMVQEDPKYRWSYVTGPEMQIIGKDHPDNKNPKHQAADLYDLIAASPVNVRPASEWNSIEIILKDKKLELYQNGAKVVSTIVGDENWNQLIAKSKFKTLADFAKNTHGKIDLQDHGNYVWFRNIKIKQL
jgi:hypothetical protein